MNIRNALQRQLWYVIAVLVLLLIIHCNSRDTIMFGHWLYVRCCDGTLRTSHDDQKV